MSDGADNSVGRAYLHAETPGREGLRGAAARVLLALAGMACLSAAGAGGWRAGGEILRQCRSLYAWRTARADVRAYAPPAEANDETGRVRAVPGRVEYEFVLGERLYVGRYEQRPRGGLPTEREEEMAGEFLPEDVLDVQYDPRDPARNTPAPSADPQLAVAILLLLPLWAWGWWLLRAGLVGTWGSCVAGILPASGTSVRGQDALPTRGRDARDTQGRDALATQGRDALATQGRDALATQGRDALATPLRGAARFLVAFSAVSVAGAAGLVAAMSQLTWPQAWVLAGAMGVLLVPIATFTLGAALRDRNVPPIPSSSSSSSSSASTTTTSSSTASASPSLASSQGAAAKQDPSSAGARSAEDRAVREALAFEPGAAERVRRGGGGCLVFGAVFQILAGAAVAGGCGFAVAQAVYRHWDAMRRLATTPGRILSSDVKKVEYDPDGSPVRGDAPSGPLVRYAPAVQFFYRLGDQEYVSERFAGAPADPDSEADRRFATREGEFDSEADAGAAARRYPRGLRVDVYYDPAWPDAGVLVPDVPPLEARWLLPIQVCALAGLYAMGAGLAAVVRLRRARRFAGRPRSDPWRIPSLGVWREGAGGWEVLARRSPFPAAVAAYAGACAAVLAAALLVRGHERTLLSPEGLAYATAACACAAVACGLLAARRVRRPLGMDAVRRVVTVASRWGAVEVALDDIAAWTLRWAPRRGSSSALARQKASRSPGAGIGLPFGGRDRSQRDIQGHASPNDGEGAPKRDSSRLGTPAWHPELGARDLVPLLCVKRSDGMEAVVHVFDGPAPWHVMGAVARRTAEELAEMTGAKVEVISDCGFRISD